MATIRCPLNESAHISMNESAVVSADGALLYSETEQCVVATAELLTRKGVGPGDRVGVLVKAGWEEVILFWSLVRIGAVVCPLGWVPAEGVAAAVERMGATWVVEDGSRAVPEGIPALPVKDLVGFTGRFVKHHRPVLELDREVVVLPCGADAEGAPVFCTHTVASCYYAALAGNGTFPLRSGAKHHWALEPLWTFCGVDTLFRCAVAGTSVAVGLSRPLSVDEINRLEVTHATVPAEGVAALLEELAGKETELTHVLVHGSGGAALEGLRAKGLHALRVLGQPDTGFYAVLDERGVVTPMRHSRVEADEAGRLRVSGKTLAREVRADGAGTGLSCRMDEGRCVLLSP